jgi:hypothetical protein
MVALGRDGRHTRLATWVVLTEAPMSPGLSTSMLTDQSSADAGDVLLRRNLWIWPLW